MSSQKKEVGEIKEGKTIDAEGISSNESGIAAEGDVGSGKNENLSSSQDKPVDALSKTAADSTKNDSSSLATAENDEVPSASGKPASSAKDPSSPKQQQPPAVAGLNAKKTSE